VNPQLSTAAQQLTTWSLLTATAGILAFLIGVYTLVGRDRKSPYLINSVFVVFLICLIGAAIDIAAQLATPIDRRIGELLLRAGAVFLLIAVAFTIQRLWTIYVRLAYFVDPGGVKRLQLLPGWRQLRAWRKRRDGPTYEHDPAALSQKLQNEIRQLIVKAVDNSTREASQADIFANASDGKVQAEVRDHQDPRSLAMALRHQGQANELLGNLAIIFLREQSHYVQYVTASRHPIEFITHLQRTVEKAGVEWAAGTCQRL
jgi:hypothetical protein